MKWVSILDIFYVYNPIKLVKISSSKNKVVHFGSKGKSVDFPQFPGNTQCLSCRNL